MEEQLVNQILFMNLFMKDSLKTESCMATLGRLINNNKYNQITNTIMEKYYEVATTKCLILQ